MRKSFIHWGLLFLLLLVGCRLIAATARPIQHSEDPGIKRSVTSIASNKAVKRIVHYDFVHEEIPKAFDSLRIAFISDLHYKSLFREEGLNDLVRLLKEQNVDLLLMGGDYQEGCEYVRPLFDSLATVKPPLGIVAVLGNNDYERCYDEIVNVMRANQIRLLEHQVDTLYKDGQRMMIAGIRNPFDLSKNGHSPTLSLSQSDFVIMLVHTPDYAEDVSIDHTDLVLAGHTHGGQIRLLGVAPALNSRYGERFLTGLAMNKHGVPVIVTNGIGTSRINKRIGAPAEIVLITLHCK